jgi:hypothetical protein
MSNLQEKAKKFSNTDGNQSAKLMREVEYDTGRYVGYLAGYKECQQEYEDKLRWISVEERIPTKKINKFVLFKNGHSSYCFKPSSLEMGMKEWIILNGITEWRSFL